MAEWAVVRDARGRELDCCPADRARDLVADGRAALVSVDPLVVQLDRVIEKPQPAPKPAELIDSHAGERILLHTCCAPCGTYTVDRLHSLGFDVTGFWYNPNVHPWQEHERRRLSLVEYALHIELPVIWHSAYDMPAFLRRLSGREGSRRRCVLCYEMRLAETARQARLREFDAFTTTLLISPHQDQDVIRQIGERLAQSNGVDFYFEDFRRGWSERGRMTTAHDLYRQQYCGCIYSEWERYNNAKIDALLPGDDAKTGQSGV